ncbi:mitochondrial carrier [Ceraceosorus guamensis]|uniref:Mitochondrial carrier n=1 Tax=Ceraceosorus guamensis TaxID=1522189 RepID=A0A316VMT5_9BASI|nr:mitochondrial carrier [Ceraceosorus guamensis]PWN38867.1 mitochondrial carrier [Ceraceosorus guamensis]
MSNSSAQTPTQDLPLPASAATTSSSSREADGSASAESSGSNAAPSNRGATSAASRLWSSWISPSSSASSAASSAFEHRKTGGKRASSALSGQVPARIPTYEEFRSQEPPQARLLRLRGLFDILLDNDDEDALAGGRAKEEWHRTAMRARYGAGGAWARGSLASENPLGAGSSGGGGGGTTSSNSAAGRSPNRNRPSFGDTQEEKTAAWGPPASPSASSSSGSARSASSSDSAPNVTPPSQSYAKELLSQCRACRAELEKERQKRVSRGGDGPDEGGWLDSATSWIPFVGSESSEDSSASSASSSRSSSTAGSQSYTDNLMGSIGSLLGMDSSDASSRNTSPSSSSESDMRADHEGEAGWVGSGVWGLSAVGSKQREKDRSLDQEIRQRGQSGQDHEHGARRKRQIEWEGFLRYAESKERELYRIFIELDKNGDMQLDASEIGTALDRAGIDLAPEALEDFIASLASSSARLPTASSSPATGARGDGSSNEAAASVVQPQTKISFPQFRDYLLLLPRKPSVGEIYRFYQVRKAWGLFGAQGIFASFSEQWGKTERHGATSVNLDGDVSMAGEERKKGTNLGKVSLSEEEKERRRLAGEGASKEETRSGESGATAQGSDASSESSMQDATTDSTAQPLHGDEEDEEEEEDSDMIHGDVAVKFLLAGGIAGAVSRTATAPFDRLKIYLITTSRQQAQGQPLADAAKNAQTAEAVAKKTAQTATRSFGLMYEAIRALYVQGGGLKSFWVGNGLNCIKIFPESAIKFLSYETSKRAFAKYVDEVADSRDISGSSRFISGGIGGITSQLAIYPVETLKTRLMSSQSGQGASSALQLRGNALLVATAKDMWKNGGLRTYYRGLGAGLVGVFPYSAIDMSTFEGIKLFWIKYTGKEEPSVLALLAFGSISGSVGATTVYPLNLVRTRLQAAGTPAHPQTYDGFLDVARKTYKNEGFQGFYRGLVPTLAKVVPAVSISYVVYEHSKKHLGVQ